MTPLANIPTVLVAGPRGAAKAAYIHRLLEARSPGERWAVVLNESGADALAPSEDVAVAVVDGGCVCCTAQLTLRVTLTRLLRESRPSRLLIELDAASHVEDVLRELQSPWLAPVLTLEPVICVAEATSSP